MISSKALPLTLLFSIGFAFQTCDPFDCDCPKPRGKYFDIQGISADSYRKRGSCCADIMGAGEEAALADYYLGIRYQVNYFSAQLPSPTLRGGGFSLISPAAACSCLEDGLGGSKERLQRFTVVTLRDFDAQHLANDTINDLLNITTDQNGTTDLRSYLRADTALIQQTDYTLTLQKRPVLRTDFAAKITISLRNGESYTISTVPVNIR